MRLPIYPLCVLALVFVIAAPARAQDTLPSDVYPDSRSRLPSLGPDSPAGVTGIVAHGSGALVRWEFALGRALSELAVLTTAREHDQPYEWSLHELEAIAVGLEPHVIDIVRDRLPLTGIRDEEAVIIQVGREIFGEHELSAETYARAGLEPHVIDIVRDRLPLTGTSDEEAVIIQVGREIFGEHELSAETYARTLELFGEPDLVGFVNVMAKHASDSALLIAFQQHLPAGQKPLL